MIIDKCSRLTHRLISQCENVEQFRTVYFYGRIVSLDFVLSIVKAYVLDNGKFSLCGFHGTYDQTSCL